MARKLPLLPIPTGDSAAYLAMAGYRPPLYGWLTKQLEDMTGGLERLPLVQLILLGCAIAVFAIELGRLLRTRWYPSSPFRWCSCIPPSTTAAGGC